MRSREEMSAGKDNSTCGALLYVTELTDDSPEALDLALGLAASHGVRLEMIHVVDLNHVQSSPDGQMGIQFRLDALARSLRRLKRNVLDIPVCIIGQGARPGPHLEIPPGRILVATSFRPG